MLLSSIGDGASWVVLSWAVYKESGNSASSLGLLVVAYTLPVIFGGLFAALLLDRFRIVNLLMTDNAIRGMAFGAAAILLFLGHAPLWLFFALAALYGSLKMFSLAGVPALIPALVDEHVLSTANALEVITFDLGAIIGPPLGGILIKVMSPAAVLVFDAVTYLILAGALFAVSEFSLIEKPPLKERRSSLMEGFAFIFNSRALLQITVMFMLFNVGGGLFSVVYPVFTTNTLHGSAFTYSLVLSGMGLGGLVASIVVGIFPTPRGLGKAIAYCQSVAGLCFLGLVSATLLPALVALFFAAAFTAPLTTWAQTLRMSVIPKDLRGRTFSILRTSMQGATPLGGILAASLVQHFGITPAILCGIFITAAPGFAGIVLFSQSSTVLGGRYSGGALKSSVEVADASESNLM